jgi:predicted nucleic acid-binding protein
MGQDYLIDTNTVIDYLNNKLPGNAYKLIDSVSSKISVITRMELLSWPGANENQTIVLETYIKSSVVYALEEPIIIKAIGLRKTYKTKLPDAIIAATALCNDLILISSNTKDFKDISGLNIINPYDPR